MSTLKFIIAIGLIIFITPSTYASESSDEQKRKHEAHWYKLNEEYAPFIKKYNIEPDGILPSDPLYYEKMAAKTSELEDSSSTEEMLKKAEENYQLCLENPGFSSTLKQRQKLEDRSFWFNHSLTCLCKLNHTERKRLSDTEIQYGETQNIAFLDVFRGFSGHSHLFLNKNLTTQLDLYIFTEGHSKAITDHTHLSGLDYQITFLESDENDKSYKYGCITHIYTDNWAQEKGYATLLLKLTIDLLFKKADIEFLAASVANFRVASRQAFVRNNFIKLDENNPLVNLGKGIKPFELSPYSLGGNYYLSREKWEAQ